MIKYEVKIGRKVVWSDTRDEYESCTDVFPAEYVARPESGEVYLIVGGEVVGRQVSLAQEQAEEAAHAAALKEG